MTKHTKFEYEVGYKHQDGSICLFKHAYIKEIDKDWIIIHTEHNGDIKLNKQDLEYVLIGDKYCFRNKDFKSGTIFELKDDESALILSDKEDNDVDINIFIPSTEQLPYNSIFLTALFLELKENTNFKDIIFKRIEKIIKEVKEEKKSN